jgi:site-specific recombinase XerD
MSAQNNRKLFDEVRDFMRLDHYSIHTERTYCDWIKRFVQFHHMKSRKDLSNGEIKIEAFLTHLAVRGSVSANDIPTIQALLGHKDVSTTMIYTHVLQHGGQGVPSPLDDLDY